MLHRPLIYIMVFVLLFQFEAAAQKFAIGTPAPVSTIKNGTFSCFLTGYYKNFVFSDWEYSINPQYHMFVITPGNALTDDYIELPEEKDKGAIADLVGTKEKMFLFRTAYRKSEKKNKLLAYQVSSNTIEVNQESIDVSEIPAEKAGRSGEFGINVSQAGNYVVVYAQYPNEKEAKEKFRITVLDQLMKTVWTKEFEYNFPAGKNQQNDVFISDRGTVFIMKRLGEDQFSGFVIANENGELKEVKLEMPSGKKIINYIVNFNEADEILVSGFYSEEADLSKGNLLFHGNYYFSFGNGGIKTKNTNAFAAPLKDVDPRYLIPLQDGKVLLAAEIFKKEKSGLSASGDDAIFYNCGNVHLFMLDNTGKNLWTAEIEKESKSVDDGGLFMQFGMHIMNDKILVFINDEKMKYSMNKGKMPFMIPVGMDGKKEKPVSLMNSTIGMTIFLLPSVTLKRGEEIVFIGVSEESFFPLTLKW